MADREKQVRERAYQIWEKEGQTEGRDQEHWSQAERELAEQEKSGAAGSSKKPRKKPATRK